MLSRPSSEGGDLHLHPPILGLALVGGVGGDGVGLPVGEHLDAAGAEGRGGLALEVLLDREGPGLRQRLIDALVAVRVGVAVDLHAGVLREDQHAGQPIELGRGGRVELVGARAEGDLPVARADHFGGAGGGLREVGFAGRLDLAAALDALERRRGLQVGGVEHVVPRGVGVDVAGPQGDREVAVVLVGAPEGLARGLVDTVEGQGLFQHEGLGAAEPDIVTVDILGQTTGVELGPVLGRHDLGLVDGVGRLSRVGEGVAVGADLVAAFEAGGEPSSHEVVVGLVPLPDPDQGAGHLPPVLVGGVDLDDPTLETGDVHVAGGPGRGTGDADVLGLPGPLAVLDHRQVLAQTADVGLVRFVEGARVHPVERVGVVGRPVGVHRDAVELGPGEGAVDVPVALDAGEPEAAAGVGVLDALLGPHEGVLAERAAEAADDLGLVLGPELGELDVQIPHVPPARVTHHVGVRVAAGALGGAVLVHLGRAGDEAGALVPVHVLRDDPQVQTPLLGDAALHGDRAAVGVVDAGHGVPGDHAPADLRAADGRRGLFGDGDLVVGARADVDAVEFLGADLAGEGHRLGGLGGEVLVEQGSASEQDTDCAGENQQVATRLWVELGHSSLPPVPIQRDFLLGVLAPRALRILERRSSGDSPTSLGEVGAVGTAVVGWVTGAGLVGGVSSVTSMLPRSEAISMRLVAMSRIRRWLTNDLAAVVCASICPAR